MLIISLCDGSAVCVGQYNLFNNEAQQIDGIFFILLFLQSIKYNGQQPSDYPSLTYAAFRAVIFLSTLNNAIIK